LPNKRPNKSFKPGRKNTGIFYLTTEQINSVHRDVSIALINIGQVMRDLTAYKQLQSTDPKIVSGLITLSEDQLGDYVKENLKSLEF
jgi:hypothetical protein